MPKEKKVLDSINVVRHTKYGLCMERDDGRKVKLFMVSSCGAIIHVLAEDEARALNQAHNHPTMLTKKPTEVTPLPMMIQGWSGRTF